MKIKEILTTLTTLGLLTWNASAQITIDTVLVGDAGNAAQSAATRNHSDVGGDGRGAVNYEYKIGTYEVTNSQYTAFLNAVASTDTHALYNSSMGSNRVGGITQSGSSGSFTYAVRSNMGDKPVNYVNFWDAARFTNWLTNGQPVGLQSLSTTESGVYNLNGITTPSNLSVTRDTNAFQNGGYAITDQDEWHKAAFYNSLTGEYSLFATRSDSLPGIVTSNANGDGSSGPIGNFANYDGGATWLSGLESPTTVGTNGGASWYGSYDMTGNAGEWIDTISSPSNRRIFGGSYAGDGAFLTSSSGFFFQPQNAFTDTGFRIVTIPEPSTILMFALTGLAVGITPFYRRLRRRKGRG